MSGPKQIDTWDEWHTFVIGLTEPLCPFPRSVKPEESIQKLVNSEYWYYTTGRAVGFLIGVVVYALIGIGLFMLVR